MNRLIIWRCTLVALIMIALCPPVYCFILLFSTGRVLEYLWPLPDPRRLWIFLSNFEAATDQESFILSDGLLLLWPIVLALALALVFNPFSRRVFYELFIWKNVPPACGFYLAASILELVFSPLGEPQGGILAWLASIPTVGWLASQYHKHLQLSSGPVMKLGWTMTWRSMLGASLLMLVVMAVITLTAYLMVAPGLALVEAIQTGSEDVVERVASHPLLTDALYDLMIPIALSSVGVQFLVGVAGFLLVPGKVFWTISGQPARN